MQQIIIYSPAKNAMQSGVAKTGMWVLEFQQSTSNENDPLMGWIGASETETQIRLVFDSLEQAKIYAEKTELSFVIRKPKKERALIVKSYANNYAYNRRESWTH
jgi:hypothetical protein